MRTRSLRHVECTTKMGKLSNYYYDKLLFEVNPSSANARHIVYKVKSQRPIYHPHDS